MISAMRVLILATAQMKYFQAISNVFECNSYGCSRGRNCKNSACMFKIVQDSDFQNQGPKWEHQMRFPTEIGRIECLEW